MDIWDQVPPCAFWNDQINRSINAETAACPNRQAAFFARSNEPCEDRTDDSRCEFAHIRMTERNSQMKRYFRDYSFTSLLPSGEIKDAEPITEDKIQKKKKAA